MRPIKLLLTTFLGDMLYVINIFLKNMKFIKDNNVQIYLYYDSKNVSDYIINQVIEFIDKEYIHIVPLPLDINEINEINSTAINTWTGSLYFDDMKLGVARYNPSYLSDVPFMTFLTQFHNRMLTKMLNMPLIDDFNFHYTKEEIDNIYDNLPDIYKNTDILLLNSIPRSNNMIYRYIDWESMYSKLPSKYKVITSLKVSNLVSTTDHNLTVRQIGALASRVKYIVGTNSGPIITCLNEFTFKNVKNIFMYDSLFIHTDNSKIIHNCDINILINKILLE